jgi:hypothetical protein
VVALEEIYQHHNETVVQVVVDQFLEDLLLELLVL